MRMVWNISGFLVLWAASVSAGAEPKLINARPIFPKGNVRWKKPGQSSKWAMRLSPDGKRILYPRPDGEPPLTAEGAPDWHKVKYELILRDLSTGKEIVLPVGLLESGWRTVSTRFNPFDPTGTQLALMKIEVEGQKVGENLTSVRATTGLVLFDIAAGKLRKTGIEGGRAFGRFNRTGNGLIVMQASREGLGLYTADLKKLKLTALTARGVPSSVCPGSDVLCLWMPPQRMKPSTPGGRPTRGPQRLVLYDIKAGKETAELPVHEQNRSLDDCETQWTADGRYLYYYDVTEDPADAAAGGRRRKTKAIARIWDRVAGKQVGGVSEAIAVGPGPTPTSMVLAKLIPGASGGFSLHDARTGSEWPLGDSSLQLIHAWGKTVAYAKRSPDGTETAYVAEIAP